MSDFTPFADVLEAAGQLSQDEQQELVGILNRRLAEANRQRVAGEIQEARREYAEGRCYPASPAELMREILQQ